MKAPTSHRVYRIFIYVTNGDNNVALPTISLLVRQ